MLQFTLNVCRLRDGPQNAPNSQILLALLVFAYLLIASLAYSSLDTQVAPLLPALQGLLISLFGTVLLLHLTRRPERFHQTAITLLASSCLLSLVDSGLDSLIAATGEASPSFLVIAWLALFMWSFVIDAHIYRHSLEISFTHAMLIAVCLFSINQFILISWYVPLVNIQ